MAKELSVFIQNVRGLRSKISEFKLNILNSDHDVMFLTETWLNQSVFDSELFGSDFSAYR